MREGHSSLVIFIILLAGIFMVGNWAEILAFMKENPATGILMIAILSATILTINSMRQSRATLEAARTGAENVRAQIEHAAKMARQDRRRFFIQNLIERTTRQSSVSMAMAAEIEIVLDNLHITKRIENLSQNLKYAESQSPEEYFTIGFPLPELRETDTAYKALLTKIGELKSDETRSVIMFHSVVEECKNLCRDINERNGAVYRDQRIQDLKKMIEILTSIEKIGLSLLADFRYRNNHRNAVVVAATDALIDSKNELPDIASLLGMAKIALEAFSNRSAEHESTQLDTDNYNNTGV